MIFAQTRISLYSIIISNTTKGKILNINLHADTDTGRTKRQQQQKYTNDKNNKTIDRKKPRQKMQRHKDMKTKILKGVKTQKTRRHTTQRLKDTETNKGKDTKI